MSPGSNGSAFSLYKSIKFKEDGLSCKSAGAERMEECVDAPRMQFPPSFDENPSADSRIVHQSWPALTKKILPPPKKRIAPTIPLPTSAARVIIEDGSKENKRSGSWYITSGISPLSPGSKRKVLGYSADGSIPPLPPLQKRLKRTTKQKCKETKQGNKYLRLVEASGILGDLKPGIMRQPMRTRKQVCAVLGAVLGSQSYEKQQGFNSQNVPELRTKSPHKRDAHQGSPAMQNVEGMELHGLQQSHCSGEEGLVSAGSRDQRTDVFPQFSVKGFDHSITVGKTERMDGGVGNLQAAGLHACSQNMHRCFHMVAQLAEAIVKRDNSDTKCPLKYGSSDGASCMMNEDAEATLCKRNPCEGSGVELKDNSQFPIINEETPPDCSLLEDDALQLDASKLWVSVTAVSVVTRWLELLRLDVKGRLSALKRSRRRVRSVIASGDLNLDAPLLYSHPPYTTAGPSSVCCPAAGNRKVEDGKHQEVQMDSWMKIFLTMDGALSLEGTKLEGWLQQINLMQAQCHKEMDFSASVAAPMPSCSGFTLQETKETEPAFAEFAASIMSNNFGTQLGDLLKA